MTLFRTFLRTFFSTCICGETLGQIGKLNWSRRLFMKQLAFFKVAEGFYWRCGRASFIHMYTWVSLRMSTPRMSAPEISTPKMSTPKKSTPKMSTSQNINSQDVNFPKYQLPRCQLPKCQLFKVAYIEHPCIWLGRGKRWGNERRKKKRKWGGKAKKGKAKRGSEEEGKEDLPQSQLQNSFIGKGLWPARSCIYLWMPTEPGLSAYHIRQSQPLALLLWSPLFLCCIYSWISCIVMSPLTASSWSSIVVALATHVRRQHCQNSHPSNPFLILKYWYSPLNSVFPPGCWVMGDWGQSTSLILIKCPVYWTGLTGCDR